MSTSLITEVAADVLADHRFDVAEGELPPLWSTLVALDWPSIALSSDLGGADGSLADLASLVATTAEKGVSAPLLEASVGRWVLAHAGHGSTSPLVVCATEEDLSHVAWARHASHLVVWSDQQDAFLIDLRDPAVRVEHGLNLAGEPRDAVHLGDDVAPTPMPEAVSRDAARARSALLSAAAVTGAARGAYERSRAHVTQREQFGRPLIALKAVANGLAGMSTELVSAEAALARALDSGAGDGESDVHAVATAKIVSARAATSIARTAHQLHGAIGVTREHSLHHVTRKLWAWRDEYGSQRAWAVGLGRHSFTADESDVWDRLTGPV